MKVIKDQTFGGERALFRTVDAIIENCQFGEGESPLKESSNLEVKNVTFGWKYPLWYTKNIKVSDTQFLEMSRSGLWYVENGEFINCDIIAPKEFRRSKHISIKDSIFHDAKETLWECEDVRLENVKATGDYFLMNSKNIEIHNFTLEGNYFADGGENIKVYDSTLHSKDSFWNCKNVYCENCTIEGEYLGWNTENLTLVNCTIISHQGLCYISHLVLKDCKILNSDLILEYCRDIQANILSPLGSIKNPISGTIYCDSYEEWIQDDERIDLNQIHIFTKKGDQYEEVK